MKLGTWVHLEKLSTTNPGEYSDGYWSEGILLADISRGKPILLARYQRAARDPGETSPVVAPGLFRSSPVVIWSKCDSGKVGIKTANSVWELSEIDPLDTAPNALPL